MLGAGRTVQIAGSDLVVEVDDVLPEDVGHSAYRLMLERSTANLSGARLSELEASASSLTLNDTEGALALTLDGGAARVRGHRGRLDLDATGADVTAAEHAGELMARLEGGSLEVAGGAGAFEARAGDARLSFDGWRGPVDLLADDSAISVHGAEHRDRWRIEGRDLQIILEGVLGDLEAVLEGGLLEARDLAAAIQATAGGGARLDLFEIAGSVHLALTDRAEALLAGVIGGVEATVTDSRLHVERVDQLTLTGTGAEVSVQDVERAERLELRDSQLSLDLRAGRAEPTLDLNGPSYADVRLKAPCVVQLTTASSETGIDVTGCELRTPGQSVPRRQDRLRYGEAPSRLTVTLSSGSVLEVEGEP